jgi:tetratricopeptide (TPR) repeat protein
MVLLLKKIRTMKTRILLISILTLLTFSVSAQESRASLALTAAIYEEEVTGNLDRAVELYQDILKNYPDDRPIAAKALYHLGLVNEIMGKQKARGYFTRLVNTYPDQKDMVALAKAKLASLGTPVPTPATMTARKLENPPADIPAYGAVSRSGRYLTFWDWETNDLMLRDLQTGENRSLTSEGTAWDENATVSQWAGISAWSADNKQIAYAWSNSTSEDRSTE